ncbi:hypothetical protein STCU_02691 [Strigomonas culicis]|uniref:Uncharacterized protein n=1 Tax=Strigomonas culicis TaxID=28005 RepID=S9W022_9TRYP|nr:hypothetical protein STCU_02691 [Strigomonas culicis]|eukprot:EPY32746.1 hypothetical protein STCU_02691 [Strigomonas culicis]
MIKSVFVTRDLHASLLAFFCFGFSCSTLLCHVDIQQPASCPCALCRDRRQRRVQVGVSGERAVVPHRHAVRRAQRRDHRGGAGRRAVRLPPAPRRRPPAEPVGGELPRQHLRAEAARRRGHPGDQRGRLTRRRLPSWRPRLRDADHRPHRGATVHLFRARHRRARRLRAPHLGHLHRPRARGHRGGAAAAGTDTAPVGDRRHDGGPVLQHARGVAAEQGAGRPPHRYDDRDRGEAGARGGARLRVRGDGHRHGCVERRAARRRLAGRAYHEGERAQGAAVPAGDHRQVGAANKRGRRQPARGPRLQRAPLRHPHQSGVRHR